MGIEISGGPFQPKLFYYSNKHIILHLSVHQRAAPFSLRERFGKKNKRLTEMNVIEGTVILH